ncbi:magnesium transporter [Vibrio galatheae]|uniref:Magnesium transporter n=1 Tax=Vibrio galatheae TaxID=579748 RepID=A0A0F4NHW5_9VIBR|nr:zinc transporter ZntB [Vibrio galatheae]KJY82735.1 magnesium transporter [Vibrio galatheae]
MNNFLISSWDFSSGKAVPAANTSNEISAEHWYHCQRDAVGIREWLEKHPLPEAVIDSLLADDTRPRFEQYGSDCFLIILRGINLNEGAQPDDMLSLRIMWYKGALISTRKVPSKAVSMLIEQLQQGKGPDNLSALLVAIASGISERISTFLAPIDEQLNEIDVPKASDLQTLNALHSRLLRLRRYLKPQRYALEDLLSADLPALSSQVHHIKNCLDTVTRINESIEFFLDQINHLLAHINQEQAETMNRNTYLFSVVAGIFLPAGFFTGLLGVNIGGIPGIDNPFAFVIFCVGLLAVIALEVVILKKLRFI